MVPQHIGAECVANLYVQDMQLLHHIWQWWCVADKVSVIQELVTVMWAISCLSWSPPLLYWKGLMDAAAAAFNRFNSQDLANCISAGGWHQQCCMQHTQ